MKQYIGLDDVVISELKNIYHVMTTGINFEFEEVDKTVYVVPKDLSKSKSFLTLNSTYVANVLYSVADIVEVQESFSFSEFTMEQLFSLINHQKALKWFTKYGLPDGGHLQYEKINKYIYDYNYFCTITLLLYSSLKLLSACQMGDRDKILKRLRFMEEVVCFYEAEDRLDQYSGQMKADVDKYMAAKSILNTKKLIDYSIDHVGNYIDREISNIHLSFSTSTYKILPNARDLLTMCFYQLATLINHIDKGNADNIDKQIENICINKDCQNLFWGHGNTHHCPNCDRRKIWARSDVAKEKRKNLKKEKDRLKREELKRGGDTNGQY